MKSETFIPLRQEDIPNLSLAELKQHMAGDWRALRDVVAPRKDGLSGTHQHTQGHGNSREARREACVPADYTQQ